MKIALIGYGKMGKMIEEIALSRGHEIVSIIDIDNQQDFESEAFASADVAIEFTAPQAAYGNFLKAFAKNVKVVSGSTGWMKDHTDDVKRFCGEEGKTLFWASNFSVGVAIFSAVNKYLTEKRLEEERIKQEQLAAQAALEEEIEEEEEQQIEIPEEKEQILEEEVQASQKVTELNIVADELVKEPPKTVEQVIENKDVIGGKDQEGSDDITKDVVKVDQTVVKEVEPPKPKEEKVEVKPEPKPEKEEVFRSAAHMPSFPGGDGALMSFINKNIRYPQAAQDNNIQGKVVVQFVVTKTGI